MAEINLQIRAEELGLELDRTSQVIQTMLKEAVQSLSVQCYNQASTIAQQNLDTTRQDYQNALGLVSSADGTEVTLYLDDALDWVENGMLPFDMREGLLNGKNAKVGKNGNRYNTVPFQHHPSAGQSGQVNKAIRNKQYIQNELSKTVKMYGLDKIVKASGNRVLQGKVAVLKDKNVIPELQGLTKFQKIYGKKVEGIYMTFRRVSDNSDPSSWQHPGYKGLHAFPQVEQFAKDEIDNILKSILSPATSI